MKSLLIFLLISCGGILVSLTVNDIGDLGNIILNVTGIGAILLGLYISRKKQTGELFESHISCLGTTVRNTFDFINRKRTTYFKKEQLTYKRVLLSYKRTQLTFNKCMIKLKLLYRECYLG